MKNNIKFVYHKVTVIGETEKKYILKTKKILCTNLRARMLLKYKDVYGFCKGYEIGHTKKFYCYNQKTKRKTYFDNFRDLRNKFKGKTIRIYDCG